MNKNNILLDLDQTLISAEATDEYDFDKNKEKAKHFRYENMDDYYIVFERPGLQKFLDYLFKNFNVCIWTAASKDYALFIIKKIILRDSDRKIDWIFFSYHCDISKKIKNNSKNLGLLIDDFKLPGYSQDNTIILDDYDEVYKTQPNMCIAAIPFEFTDNGSENDTYLYNLLKVMKKINRSKANKTEPYSIQIQKELNKLK